ncbi:uncharacterized protein LOC133204981 [Saccostrea echinata]|uniref:uncharacterized protein LOC133204981 n=1 Tax=Saccostrea echinata TaxID=191078 RepID=UPI002A8043A4|nr:uncharacterized protein LOC133204981 [Saccostrea echinata]
MKGNRTNISLSIVMFCGYYIHVFANAAIRLGVTSDYDTASQNCPLVNDFELKSSDFGAMEPGQSYWVSGKLVELGCRTRDNCSRLVVGQTRGSPSQSLDFICRNLVSREHLTRMAVRCANGYEVASIMSYEDIRNLHNRTVFPTNRAMIIRNFNKPGYLETCKVVKLEGDRMTFSYQPCSVSLPPLCLTGKRNSLTTLIIEDYSSVNSKVPNQRKNRFRPLTTLSPTVSNVTLQDNITRTDVVALENNDIRLFGLGPIHLLSIGTAVIFTFIVLLVIIIALIKRNRRERETSDPPSVKDIQNEYASWFSSKEQLTEESKGNGEGEDECHYMTIPADREYQSLDLLEQSPEQSHAYTSIATSNRTRVFKKKLSVSLQR